MPRVVVGEVLAGRYELLELVGTGGMSSVYRAHDRMLERSVALKLLHDRYSDDEDYVERFRREARAAAMLSHPNIVTVIDRGEQEGRQFIVFEHVDGTNLKELIRSSGPLPVWQALELTLQIGRALSFAHEHGLVHRDVKPQNVLLNGDGRAKVTDFGIARAADADGGTLTGTVLGTSHYLAPEQARGEHVDAQSDVYSLGAVLYELLTGEVLFPGDNAVTVAMRHVNEPAPSVLERRPDVPPRVAQAVARALEKDPARRLGSMRELVDELEACLAELQDDGAGREPTLIVRLSEPLTAVVHPRPVRPRRRFPLWPVIALLGGLAIAAIVAGVYLVQSGTEHASSPPAPSGRPVHLAGVASFDPFGDNKVEYPDIVGRATDGNISTYWQTESYTTVHFGNLKKGVGLVLDAGTSHPRSITVQSGTPGFRAQIKTGAGTSGPFEPISDSQQVGSKTTFELKGTPQRYLLLWITELPPGDVAHVNEVSGTS